MYTIEYNRVAGPSWSGHADATDWWRSKETFTTWLQAERHAAFACNQDRFGTLRSRVVKVS